VFLSKLTNLQHKGELLDRQARAFELVKQSYPITSNASLRGRKEFLDDWEHKLVCHHCDCGKQQRADLNKKINGQNLYSKKIQAIEEEIEYVIKFFKPTLSAKA